MASQAGPGLASSEEAVKMFLESEFYANMVSAP
jgi:hypothetical protein